MCPQKRFLNNLLTQTLDKQVLVCCSNLTEQTGKIFQNLLCSWTPSVLLPRPQLVRNHFLVSLPKKQQDDMIHLLVTSDQV